MKKAFLFVAVAAVLTLVGIAFLRGKYELWFLLVKR